MKLKSGIYAAQLVPYSEDGAVMEESLSAMIERNIKVGKVDGLYIGGSTGEAFLSSKDAKKRVLEIAAETNDGRVSMIAQVGSINVKEAEELATLAATLDYDAVSAVTPYYYKFTFAEICRYYFRLADAANLPMLVYSIPAFTGISFDMQQSKELLRHPLIAGFKYTSNDLFTMERLISTFPDKMIFSGYDETLICGRVLGAYGAIGSTYNLFASTAKCIWEQTGNGRLSEARIAQAKLNNAIQKLSSIGLYQALKKIIGLSGIDTGGCLPPFAKLSEEQSEMVVSLAKEFEEMGLL
ncbi:MAG TPA: N-acetylneuraminate lyase [Spirochaetales bacterium]|nr:N-acetylneuraminate lyase [Spirochaetales bacterium]